jgi:ABC-type uncharacterized transport system involved in gliding motility auxiliary subunit
MFKRVFDIIGWLGTALVLAAVAVFFSKPDWQPYSRWLAWGGLVCLLVYAIGQWRDIARLFAGRSARLGSISLASALVVLAILAAINYISSREHKRWDLTATSEFTLSPQTTKVLKSLDSPLKMTVFARETEFARYKERLPEYEYASKKVNVEYVDPDKKPALAKQMAIQSYGTVAIEYKGRIERVVGDSEQDLTNGVIKVVTGQERKVYFTQGHGEKDTTSAERSGYNSIATQLGRDNMKVEKLVLAQQQDVPADATAVIAAGPRIDFLQPEIEALKRYLEKGGKLMMMLDPPDKMDAPPLTNLIALSHDWGIDLGNNVVVDVSGVGRLLGTDETVPVAASYPSHPIVEKFDLLTAFPLARSATAAPGGVGGHFAQSFVETTARSWAESDLGGVLSGKPIKLEEDKGDKKGPISLAAAVSATAPAAGASADGKGQDKKDEAKKPETRVVVFGDSDFASNFALGIQGNRDLFLNAVNWLSQQENLIAIRPRESADRRVTMTSAQQTRVLLLVLLIIPGFVLGSGVYTWWRRR